MKLIVNIPDDLMKEASELSNIHNENELIVTALKTYSRSIKKHQLTRLKGTFDFDTELDSLRNRKSLDI